MTEQDDIFEKSKVTTLLDLMRELIKDIKEEQKSYQQPTGTERTKTKL